LAKPMPLQDLLKLPNHLSAPSALATAV
jgi:hypothetical protein